MSAFDMTYLPICLPAYMPTCIELAGPKNIDDILLLLLLHAYGRQPSRTSPTQAHNITPPETRFSPFHTLGWGPGGKKKATEKKKMAGKCSAESL